MVSRNDTLPSLVEPSPWANHLFVLRHPRRRWLLFSIRVHLSIDRRFPDTRARATVLFVHRCRNPLLEVPFRPWCVRYRAAVCCLVTKYIEILFYKETGRCPCH